MNMNDLILDLHRLEAIQDDWAHNPTCMAVLDQDGIPALQKAQRILHLVRLAYGDNIDELEEQLKQPASLCMGDTAYELRDDNSKILRHRVTAVETRQTRYEAFSPTLHQYIQFTERDIGKSIFASYDEALAARAGRKRAKRNAGQNGRGK